MAIERPTIDRDIAGPNNIDIPFGYGRTGESGGDSVNRIVSMLFLALMPLQGTCVLAQNASRLGNGAGVDHVGVMVRDLDVAKSDFEHLGFTVSSGGSFPGGLSNKIINFKNGTYLELLAVNGSQPASDDVSEFVVFAQKHEGAMFLGLEVSSAEGTAAYLRSRNFDVKDPAAGSIAPEGDTGKPKMPLWYTVEMNEKPALGKRTISLPIFFIQYSVNRSTDLRATQRAIHANTADAIRSVWMVVANLSAQMQTLRDAGFETTEAGTVKVLGARGRAYKVGAGQIVLLDAKDKSPEVKEFVAKFGEGIIGISVEVANLEMARAAAQSGAHATFANVDSRGFLVPAALAHGLWIEMSAQSSLR